VPPSFEKCHAHLNPNGVFRPFRLAKSFFPSCAHRRTFRASLSAGLRPLLRCHGSTASIQDSAAKPVRPSLSLILRSSPVRTNPRSPNRIHAAHGWGARPAGKISPGKTLDLFLSNDYPKFSLNFSPMEDAMQLHSDIKPISWLKNNAKQMVETVDETGNPMIITQNGEAKAVVMNVRAYDQMQESLALLRILADSSVDVEAGRLRDSDEVFADIRRMIAEQRDARK